MKQRKAFSREEVKLMVVQALAIEYQKHGQDYAIMTLPQLAHKLNRTASTKFRDILTELVIDGSLLVREEAFPGIAGKRRFYALSGRQLGDEIRRMKMQAGQATRHIRVNSRQMSFNMEVQQCSVETKE